MYSIFIEKLRNIYLKIKLNLINSALKNIFDLFNYFFLKYIFSYD